MRKTQYTTMYLCCVVCIYFTDSGDICTNVINIQRLLFVVKVVTIYQMSQNWNRGDVWTYNKCGNVTHSLWQNVCSVFHSSLQAKRKVRYISQGALFKAKEDEAAVRILPLFTCSQTETAVWPDSTLLTKMIVSCTFHALLGCGTIQ